MKQTAVEWLIEEIENHYIINNGRLDPIIVMELKRQAKAMEKDQIKSSFNKGYSNGYSNGLMYIEGEDFHTFANSDANIYYNETLNQNKDEGNLDR